MRIKKLTGFPIVVLVIAAVIMAAAGTAIASNMGFKLNKGIFLTSLAAPNQGSNWTSIPYFNPYVSFNDFCAQTGLPSAGPVAARAVLVDFCATTFPGCTAGNFRSHTCGSDANPLVSGYGLRIRTPALAAGSLIIVGSHNPALNVVVPAVAGSVGSYWFGVPYHTTAVTIQDLCNQAGMVSAGPAGVRGQVVRVDAAVAGAGFITGTCGGTNNLTPLQLGEAVRLRQPPGGVSFLPSHF